MGEPTSGRPRWPYYLVVGLFVAALIVVVVVSLIRRTADEARLRAADAGQVPATDRGARPDLRAEGRPADALVRARARPTRDITQGEVRALQVRHRRLLNACYDLAGRHAPSSVASRVDVTVVLADGGGIRSVKVEGTDDKALIRCLRITVKSWRFSGNLRAQEVTFPVIFTAR